MLAEANPLYFVLVLTLLIAVLVVGSMYGDVQKQLEHKAVALLETEKKLEEALKLEAQHRRQAEVAVLSSQESQRQLLALKEGIESATTLLNKDNKSFQAVDDYLRVGLIFSSFMGRALSVRVLLVPTGRVSLEWKITAQRPCAPKVAISREGIPVAVEYAFRGTYPDQLVPGCQYIFRFHVTDGHTVLEENMIVSVRIPSPEEWARRVQYIPSAEERKVNTPPVDPAAERRAKRRKRSNDFVDDIIDQSDVLREAEEKVKAMGLEKELEDIALSKIEAVLAEEDEKGRL